MTFDLFTESGTFVHGLFDGKKYFKEFVLEEEVMEHTLRVANDTTLDIPRLAGDEANGIEPDEDYYSACLLAKRLKVAGLDKVTPEMVLRLSRMDGRLLLFHSAQLEKRRELFRDEISAASEGRAGADEAGFPGKGDSSDAPGENP